MADVKFGPSLGLEFCASPSAREPAKNKINKHYA